MDQEAGKARGWLFVTDCLEIGGSERAFVQIVSRLSTGSPENSLAVALVHNRGDLLEELPRNLELVSVGAEGGYLLKNLKRCLKLCRLLWRIRPRAVVSFLIHVNVFVLFCSFFFPRARYVVVEQCAISTDDKTGQVRGLPWWKRLGLKILYGRAFRIVAISQGIKDEMVRLFSLPAEKIVVIHNPLDLERMQEFRSAPETGVFFFAFLGRFVEQKNLRMLLSAFASFSRLHPEARLGLKMIGDGPLREDLERAARELEIQDRVQWSGMLREPWRELAKAHCLVLTSNFEGFANVLAEALALGKPVIATDCCYGPAEIVSAEEFLGILVPVGDAARLAEAMERLHRDYGRWAAQEEARVRSARRFSLDSIAAAYAGVLNA